MIRSACAVLVVASFLIAGCAQPSTPSQPSTPAQLSTPAEPLTPAAKAAAEKAAKQPTVKPKDLPAVLYVSTKGDDSWSGALPDPSADGKDGPLAKPVLLCAMKYETKD